MWRAMGSLLVLRDQVNALAPNRSRASDGLVGDEAHQGTDSDHNPHDVEGVGRDIVTATDLTHDPAGGFDSYKFAEVLRLRRDRRIKYVISNGRLFSSYTSSSGRQPWAWGPYSGSNNHAKHVHISVLDAPIADTRTPWDLEGFAMLTPQEQYLLRVILHRQDAILHNRPRAKVPAFTASNGQLFPAIDEENHLAAALAALGSAIAADGDPIDFDALTAAAAEGARTGVLASADDLAAALLAELPDGGATPAEVEQALRKVLGGLDGAVPPQG